MVEGLFKLVFQRGVTCFSAHLGGDVCVCVFFVFLQQQRSVVFTLCTKMWWEPFVFSSFCWFLGIKKKSTKCSSAGQFSVEQNENPSAGSDLHTCALERRGWSRPFPAASALSGSLQTAPDISPFSQKSSHLLHFWLYCNSDEVFSVGLRVKLCYYDNVDPLDVQNDQNSFLKITVMNICNFLSQSFLAF